MAPGKSFRRPGRQRLPSLPGLHCDRARPSRGPLWRGARIGVRHARQAEAQRGEWWSAEGAEFLAEAADCLDRVWSAALAAECLERAQREPQKAAALIAMADCALLARHGDPQLALARLSAVHRHGIAPREYWRVTLLRAYAAFRLGDDRAGALAAQAFEEAATLGQPQVPMLRERELTEALLGLAADTGLPAARALETASLPIAVSVLGRFELTRGGRSVTLGGGQEVRLLKLVAASGGRVHVEQGCGRCSTGCGTSRPTRSPVKASSCP